MMRRKMMVMFILVGCLIVHGQVCNTASTSKSGMFSIGIAPIIFSGNGNDLGLYLCGGYGITKSTDLSLKLQLKDNSNYFGGDFEFVVLGGVPTISLATGVHAQHDLGLDFTLNITFPVRKIVSIYCGIDNDIVFRDNSTDFPLWGFIGFQVMTRRSLGVFMEIDIELNEVAKNMLVLGINAFF